MPESTFPARLRAARAAAGLTQQQLADRLGWHQTRVGKLEADSYSYRPTRATVAALAGALGVMPADLDPDFAVTSLPDGAVVLRPDPDSEGAYRPWRDCDREAVGPDAIGHARLGDLARLLASHGRPLCLLP